MDTEPEHKIDGVPTPIIQPMHVDCEDLQTRALPRADGGKDAWLVLAGCFVLEVLVWGYASRTVPLRQSKKYKLIAIQLPILLRRFPKLLLHS